MDWFRRKAPWLLLGITGLLLAGDAAGGPGDLGRMATAPGLAAVVVLLERRTKEASTIAAETRRLWLRGGGGQHKR